MARLYQKWSVKFGQSAKLVFDGRVTGHVETEVPGGVQAQGGFGGPGGRRDGLRDRIAARNAPEPGELVEDGSARRAAGGICPPWWQPFGSRDTAAGRAAEHGGAGTALPSLRSFRAVPAEKQKPERRNRTYMVRPVLQG